MLRCSTEVTLSYPQLHMRQCAKMSKLLICYIIRWQEGLQDLNTQKAVLESEGSTLPWDCFVAQWCPFYADKMKGIIDSGCSFVLVTLLGGWLWGGVTVRELPSEHPTDSLLEQIPLPAQKTATFRSSSDCFHADTNKGTHLTFLSQAWGDSKASCVS